MNPNPTPWWIWIFRCADLAKSHPTSNAFGLFLVTMAGSSINDGTDADRVIDGHRMSLTLQADARRWTPRRWASDKAALESPALCGAVPISVIEREGMCSTIREGGDGLPAKSGSIERRQCRSPERPAGSLALRRTYPRPRRRCTALRPP